MLGTLSSLSSPRYLVLLLASLATQSVVTGRNVEGQMISDHAGLEWKLGNCGVRWVWLGHWRSASPSPLRDRRSGGCSCPQPAGAGTQGGAEDSPATVACELLGGLLYVLRISESVGPQKHARSYKYL